LIEYLGVVIVTLGAILGIEDEPKTIEPVQQLKIENKVEPETGSRIS